MKIDANERAIERSGDIKDSLFTVKSTGKAFKILSSSLYKNKIRAVVREISCNAHDAHVSVGKGNVPFETHLPSVLEPYFSVRDFGPGLCETDVYSIYTRYFESTKTESNDYVGALGLGSKSPFSYTDSYTVTSFFDGYKTIYALYMNEEGCPVVARLGESSQTEEPSGLLISMPVTKQTDVRKFADEAADVYQHFDPKPTVTGYPNFKITEKKYVVQTKSYSLLSNVSRPSVIMGNIAYPVDMESIKQYVKPNTLLHQNLRCTNSLPIEFNVSIGEVDFTAGREDLSYDERVTVPKIMHLYDNFFTEIQKTLDDKFANCTNEFEARILYYEEFMKYGSNGYPTGLSALTYANIFPNWNGKRINSDTLEVKVSKDLLDVKYVRVDTFQVNLSSRISKAYEKDPKTKNNVEIYKFHVNCNKDINFLICDVKSRLKERARIFHDSIKGKNKHIYTVEYTDQTALDEFLKNFPNVNVAKASDFELGKNTKAKVKFKLLTDEGAETANIRDCTKIDVVDLEAGGNYLVSKNSFVQLDGVYGNISTKTTLKEMVKYIKGPIYIIPMTLLGRIDDNEKWTPAEDFLRDKLKKEIDALPINDIVFAHNQRTEGNHYGRSKVVENFEKYKYLTRFGFATINNFCEMREKYDATAKQYEHIIKLAPMFKVELPKFQRQPHHTSIHSLSELIYDAYPLLKYISGDNLTTSEVVNYLKERDSRLLTGETK